MRPFLSFLLLVCIVSAKKNRMEDIRFHYDKANQYAEEGKMDEAISSYLLVIDLNDHEKNPTVEAGAYYNLGGLYRAQDKLPEAIECFHKTLEIDDTKPHVHGFLASTYEMQNNYAEAIKSYSNAVELEPSNPAIVFSLAKALEKNGNTEEAVEKYRESVRLLREQKVPANTFLTPRSKTLLWAYYLHSLGHLLQHLGRQKEAVEVYQVGVEIGMWRSPYQRFLSPRQHEFPGQKPWYGPEDSEYPTEVVQLLEQNFEKIREEALALAANPQANFELEPERLHDAGLWNVMEFIDDDGNWHSENCKSAPNTCAVIAEISKRAKFDSCFSTTDCDSFYSRLKPGTHITPHCGPTNFRLRLHLGLQIPEGVAIRVADETRTWQEGKVIVFDDAFEHEVWHNGTFDRIILCVDIWHPLVPQELRH